MEEQIYSENNVKKMFEVYINHSVPNIEIFDDPNSVHEKYLKMPKGIRDEIEELEKVLKLYDTFYLENQKSGDKKPL